MHFIGLLYVILVVFPHETLSYSRAHIIFIKMIIKTITHTGEQFVPLGIFIHWARDGEAIFYSHQVPCGT